MGRRTRQTQYDAEPPPGEGIGVHGYFLAQLKDAKTGEVQGDSGWVRNVITDVGYSNFIIGALGAVSGSAQAGWIAIGDASAADVTNTTVALPGASANYKRLSGSQGFGESLTTGQLVSGLMLLAGGALTLLAKEKTSELRMVKATENGQRLIASKQDDEQ